MACCDPHALLAFRNTPPFGQQTFALLGKFKKAVETTSSISTTVEAVVVDVTTENVFVFDAETVAVDE